MCVSLGKSVEEGIDEGDQELEIFEDVHVVIHTSGKSTIKKYINEWLP